MRVRLPVFLFALLALTQLHFMVPAFAAPSAPLDGKPAVLQQAPDALQACPANGPGVNFAQLDCCKGHKGICGCRAGKIVCCDNAISKEPGCTCHGDEGVAE